MAYMIMIDENAIKECVESNVFQSPHFEAGARLAKSLGGDQAIPAISTRLTPHWSKDVLYLLHSRTATGYLLFDSCVFSDLPHTANKDHGMMDTLLVFQRVCRFAIKQWNHFPLSGPAEQWLSNGACGVVFPFPRSSHTGFRVTLKRGFDIPRIKARHGTRILFAFAAGIVEAQPTADQQTAYKRAFEELSTVRLSIDVQIRKIELTPGDLGYHPLVLSQAQHSQIRFQSYERWLSRLTSEQTKFVTSPQRLPQRVEGPAGTGKTLCLMLRAYFLCQVAEEANKEFRVLFIAHSEATRNAIEIMLNALNEKSYIRSRDDFAQSIELFTLQEWCGKLLGTKELSNTQYLDQDALQAKELRKAFLRDIVTDCKANEPEAFRYLSEKCRDFFQSENTDYVAEILQHEIGVMIKGRASENLDAYIELSELAYGLPTPSENDRRYVFSLYKEYQKVLNEFGAFDTDDIVLTALGSLNTPIWRRRRATEGYNAVVIDETHLFNLNELSVFHFLILDPQTPQIIFSIDRSQAPGERGITTMMVKEILAGTEREEVETKTKVIFRCAPEIVRLAEAITSAGATLFTTFENPLLDVFPVLLASDEAGAEIPVYWECANDIEMYNCAVKRVGQLCNELKCPESEIVIIAMTADLLLPMQSALLSGNKKFIEILRRGDLETVQRGQKEGAVFLSHPDYVGGLEFKAVVMVGVDEGRVPTTEGSVREESRHFLEFKACNRLYVAISRARLRVELLMSRERGRSKLLEHAVHVEAIRPLKANA
jgi:superfamily I DNA/RNA helicase